MNNMKIRVNSADESKEAQELFFKLGATLGNGDKHAVLVQSIIGLAVIDGLINFVFNEIVFFNIKQCKEITLPELRAMANPMKEYLNANRNHEFVLSTEKDDGFIEIPEGMNFAYKDEFNIHFTKLEMGYRDSVLVWQRDQDEPFLTPETTLNDQYAEIEQVRQAVKVKSGSDSNHALDAMYFGLMGAGAAQASGGAAQAVGGVDATLSQRQSQYGCYEDVAHVTQQILSALRIGNYDELPAPMKESLHMIASKMARIVNGDPEYLDNWHDIGGYAKLIEKLIKGE